MQGEFLWIGPRFEAVGIGEVLRGFKIRAPFGVISFHRGDLVLMGDARRDGQVTVQNDYCLSRGAVASVSALLISSRHGAL